MLTFRLIVCLFMVSNFYAFDFQPNAVPQVEVVADSFLSRNVLIRAKSPGSPVRFDHVDLISLGLDSGLNPLLTVQGRICLSIEGDQWCDVVKHIFDLPNDNAEIFTKNVNGNEFVELAFREGSELIIVGRAQLTNDEISEVEINESVILFYDRNEEVPALLWLAPSHESLKNLKRRARFDRVYDRLN